ncbi:MAG: LPS-assembly protein LptD [Gemmatimonadetes bacterium]|uniref:LPS-assembly protein LptD n=1 Tax=Candidatus Kutchimonas denitrificans TaxID=3056748 RepID=A0AAE4ZAM7_9BACT|nr:LPS-assembly protein LptD [Gemmatimonadota bacterium]NIR73915.1 LPS-assembly protein LptD [Candidatus Kutchimonas denitrificans]NIR99721.1 LPS-assembly protein LptD [Gemmatimonadota bacterium]NIT65306.1 LPS-assembly protein LptD [Gemmatimonadota bacterium]NIW73755.1 hypothetical protein [Gemmatimonadota bacterium]
MRALIIVCSAAALTLGAAPAPVFAAPYKPYNAALSFAPQDTTRRQPLKDLAPPRDEPDAETPGDSAAVERGEPFPPSDSIMEALMQRAGYRPVVYQGDTLVFTTSDRAIHIRERAHIERAGDQYYADSVVYQGDTRWVTGFGNMRLINAKGQEVNSEVGPLVYDTDRRIGTIRNSETRWEAWHVAGDFTLEGTDTLWVSGGHFTTCDLPEPHYRFEADKIKLILGNIVVAWPVRLYFGDVPVFWFPFMAQDVRQGRHSGILPLQFGVNDIIRNSPGRNRHISNIGYYWAINDYMDAQLSMDWWSDTWTRLDGFFRYKWVRRFIDGGLAYSHFLLPDGGREISGSWNHRQRFGERADLRASVQFVSSQQFQQDAEFNPERLTQNIRSDVGFTRRFDWGSLSLSGQRVQPLSEGQATTTTLPQLSLTLSPIVLTPARSPLDARWYNGLTWTGSTNLSHTLTQPPAAADERNLRSAVSSGLTLGSLNWNSNASYNETRIDKPDTLRTDTSATVIGSQVRRGTLAWRTSMGYRQRLIGTTNLTPSLNLDGSFFRSNQTGFEFISAPTRVSVRASLNSDIYGFFPGIGPAERIRHKFSPNLSWSYSPEVEPDTTRDDIVGFNPAGFQERHTLSVGLNQTFEAKLRPREEPPPEEAADDTTSGVGRERQGREATQEARKLTILAINTSAVAYDFVEGEFTTDRLSNSITSDLLRGLQVRVEHDLFREEVNSFGEEKKFFDPFLTQLNLSFSVGERTLAALLGGGIADRDGIINETQPFEELEDEAALAEEVDQQRREAGERGDRRPWSLSVNYSLVRARPEPAGNPELEAVEADPGSRFSAFVFRPIPDVRTPTPNRQSLSLNLGFSPTSNWTLSWRTTYDIEAGEFVDQVVNLRRDLHRWSANFQFLKASNGNITFNFSVHLSDLRDIKFDYRQESRAAGN